MSRKLEEAKTVVDFHVKRIRKNIELLERKKEQTQSEKIKIGETLAFLSGIKTMMSEYDSTLSKNLGKIPPAAVDLEQAILGAIIFEPGFQFDKVKSFLLPDHFYTDAHAQIYSVILSMNAEGKAFDLRSLVFELRKKSILEIVGGPVYLTELTNCVSSAANLEYHARCLIEFSIKRQLITHLGQIVLDSYEDSTDCFELIDRAKKELHDIEQRNIKK